jgi:hypothetical protein
LVTIGLPWSREWELESMPLSRVMLWSEFTLVRPVTELAPDRFPSFSPMMEMSLSIIDSFFETSDLRDRSLGWKGWWLREEEGREEVERSTPTVPSLRGELLSFLTSEDASNALTRGLSVRAPSLGGREPGVLPSRIGDRSLFGSLSPFSAFSLI